MRNKFLLAIFFLIAQTQLFAAYRPVMSIGFGADFLNKSLNQTISLIPPFDNTYKSSGTNTQPVISFFLGAETQVFCNLQAQIGVNYSQSQTYHINGYVYQFADPSMGNLTYKYHIKSQRFLLDTKWLLTYRQHYHPFLTLGAGEAINYADGYQETPVSSDNVPMLMPFNDRTYHVFTYEIGLGVDMDVCEHVRIGLGYRYVDLGKAGLGTSPIEETNQTIHFNHLYTNEILAQLTFVG